MSTENSAKKQHSVKVPRLYKVAAGVLRDFQKGEGSVKTLVHSDKVLKKHPNFKAIFALVTSCVNHLKEIQDSFQAIDLINKEKPLDEALASILVTELIWGKGELPGESKPIKTIAQYGDEIKKVLKIGGANFTKNSDTVTKRPRFVRINILKADPEEVYEHLERDGFEWLFYEDGTSYDDFVAKIKTLQRHQYLQDFHVKDLLVFAENAEFHNHPLYLEGKIILQDKASCLPVCALDPRPGSVVLDACAAPGMKTSQLASHVAGRFGKRGRVIAIERDEKRCQTLKSLVNKNGADEYVQIKNVDFLGLNPQDYPEVEFILLDPTCSGSGMKDRAAGTTDVSEKRLGKLASLQCKMLRHALGFPNVKRVSYSTCSIEKKENEEVIADVLSNPSVSSNFEVADCLPKWDRRGLGRKKFRFAPKLVRSDPDKDLCIGFFVAILQRKEKSAENEEASSENLLTDLKLIK